MQVVYPGVSAPEDAGKQVTVIAYGDGSLGGDIAVQFTENDDGDIDVIVQDHPSGPYAQTRTVARFRHAARR